MAKTVRVEPSVSEEHSAVSPLRLEQNLTNLLYKADSEYFQLCRPTLRCNYSTLPSQGEETTDNNGNKQRRLHAITTLFMDTEV